MQMRGNFLPQSKHGTSLAAWIASLDSDLFLARFCLAAALPFSDWSYRLVEALRFALLRYFSIAALPDSDRLYFRRYSAVVSMRNNNTHKNAGPCLARLVRYQPTGLAGGGKP